MDVFDRIIALLDQAKCEYVVLEHGHVHTSEQAANVRGTKLEEAAKALILKSKEGKFYQFVVSGNRRLALKKVKKILGVKNISLAPPTAVFELTKLKVGTIPPFGNLFGVEVFVDDHVLDNEFVVFSAGSHFKSIRMKAKEYIKIIQGVVVDVSE